MAFDRKWIEGGRSGAELLGSEDASSVADLNQSVEAVQRIRVIPVDGSAIVQLVVAIGSPMLVVIATRVPLVELAKWLVGALF